MAITVTDAHVQQYKDNIYLLSEQQGSMLQGSVTRDNQVGRYAYFDRLGSAVATEITDRGKDIVHQDAKHSRRRVGMRDFHVPFLLTSEDQIRMLINPTGAYVKKGANAIGHAKDRRIISAFTAAAAEGFDGSTSTAFPAAQQIANGGTNLTVAKINKAVRIMMENDVNPAGTELYCAISPIGWEKLITEAGFTSRDYTSHMVLNAAFNRVMWQGYLGINFCVMGRDPLTETNFLPKTGNVRSCFMWVPQSMGLNMAKEMTVNVDVLVHKEGRPTQVYLTSSFDAVRIEDGLVVQIDIDETA